MLIRTLRQHWRKITAVIGIAIAAGLFILYRQLDLRAIHAWAAELDGYVVFILLTVLPLTGFSSTLVQIVAGVRFGPIMGTVLASIAILIQILISYALNHWLRGVFQTRLAKVRSRIPSGAHIPMTVFAVLLPGVPYFAKNYVIPLLGVPLRISLLIAWPLHVIRASVPVFFGGHVRHFTFWGITGLMIYGLAIALAGYWAFRRMQVTWKKPGDQTAA